MVGGVEGKLSWETKLGGVVEKRRWRKSSTRN